VHEEGEPVGRRDVGWAPARVGLERLDDLHIACVELATQLGNLFLVQIVICDERLEFLFFDCSALLDFLEKGAGGCFKNGAQFFSLPS
jgi:hypothetical protein